MFEYLGDILCVQGGWLYQEGDIMNLHNYKNLLYRQRIKVVRRGCRNTPSLVEFASLPAGFMDLIVEHYAMPQQAVQEKTFVEEIEADQKAIAYYNEYILSDGSSLPENAKCEYARLGCGVKRHRPDRIEACCGTLGAWRGQKRPLGAYGRFDGRTTERCLAALLAQARRQSVQEIQPIQKARLRSFNT